jgi:hypothetical protein
MSNQYARKASLVVMSPSSAGNNPSAFTPGSALDLSEFRIKFRTAQQDEESPNNCSIRVYNLSPETMRQVSKEFTRVVLQAGYEDSFGVIFDGTIKQFRIGRESGTDTYLDILAADGDIWYNFGVVNQTLAAGSTSRQRLDALLKAAEALGVSDGSTGLLPTGGILPRGKVLFGMPKALMRTEAASRKCTWNIANGKVNIIPLDGVLPGEAVVLTAQTGLIHVPEATVDGVKVKCLLNPKIDVGGQIRIDNASVNKTLAAQGNPANVAFNSFAGIQQFADVSHDGFYRVYVVEHEGDTRGHEWYSNVVCLTMDASTKKVKPYGSP